MGEKLTPSESKETLRLDPPSQNLDYRLYPKGMLIIIAYSYPLHSRSLGTVDSNSASKVVHIAKSPVIIVITKTVER